MKPSLLLHICCAPCSIIPIEDLSTEFSITGFFYNPNIHPFKEYILRKEATYNLITDYSIPMLYGAYPYRDFLQRTLPVSTSTKRCSFCYDMRMEGFAERFQVGQFDYCSSTLFFSPYQNHDIIRAAADKWFSKDVFLYRNWSLRYIEGMTKARDRKYYCQSYCGCIFSNEDRYSKTKKLS